MATGRLRALPDYLDNLRPDGFQADPETLETASRHTLALVDKTKKDVLGTYVVVVKEPGFFLSEYYDSPCPVGKPFKHFLPRNFSARFSGALQSIAEAGT